MLTRKEEVLTDQKLRREESGGNGLEVTERQWFGAWMQHFIFS